MRGWEKGRGGETAGMIPDADFDLVSLRQGGATLGAARCNSVCTSNGPSRKDESEGDDDDDDGNSSKAATGAWRLYIGPLLVMAAVMLLCASASDSPPDDIPIGCNHMNLQQKKKFQKRHFV